MNIAHQQKKFPVDAIRRFRDRFDLPVPDDKLEEVPFLKFEEGSKELEYLRARRQELGGDRPRRRRRAPEPLEAPPLATFERLLKSTEDREISTTMALVQIMSHPRPRQEARPARRAHRARRGAHLRDGGHVPAARDLEPRRPALHARGRRAARLLPRGRRTGQVLQEGITEAGSMADWMAAASAYSVHAVAMIPFYLFYSMFGFQRVGDLAWAAGDMRCRGFLVGGTVRPDDAERRGAPARGRPLARVLGGDPELPLLRSDVRRTRSRSSCRTGCAACTRSRRTSTTT